MSNLSSDEFSVEESSALLQAIFPNYADMQGRKPAPEIGAFLRALRSGELGETGAGHTVAKQADLCTLTKSSLS
jgi:hypothetical protein